MNMRIILVGLMALTVFAVACEDPAANKPKAQTANVNTANAQANTAPKSDAKWSDGGLMTDFKAEGDAIEVTSNNAAIEFTGSKVTGKHDGGFKEFNGMIDLVGGVATKSRVLIDIKTDSVFSDDNGLTDHLKTADFFEVEKFPRAGFKSTSIVADKAKGADAYTVTGELTLRGVTKSITFPATIKVADKNVSVNAEFSINRKDFGIVYAGKADNLIRDDVVMRLKIGGDGK